MGGAVGWAVDRGVRPYRGPIRARAGAWVLAAACSCESSPGPPDHEGSETTAEASPGDDRLLVLPPLRPCGAGTERLAAVRMVSWNVSAGRVSSLAEVQAVLEGLDADVIALQELDVLVRRTGSVDQPRVLAEALGHAYAFAASVEFDGGDFGLAVLSRLPFAAAERIDLPSEGGYEPRIALDVTVCAGALPLRVVDVHADFVPEVNTANLVALGEAVGPTTARPTILAGDLNAVDTTPGVASLVETTAAVDVLATWDPGPTKGTERIDYVLASPALAEAVTDAARVETQASDHVPLRVDVALP